MVPLGALREAREQLKATRAEYGWLPKESVGHVRNFVERYQQDPVGTLAQQVQALLGHPQYGPQLQALMGGSTQDAEPGPDYINQETGEPAYSPAALKAWAAWNKRQSASELDQRLQPFQSYLTQQRQREQESEQRQQIDGMRAKATAKAQELFTPLNANPDFVANKAEIQKRWEGYVAKDEDGRQKMTAEAALYRAFSEVVYEKVIPGLSQRERSAVVSQLNRKPGATTPNPARTPAGTFTKAPVDFREALERKFGTR